MTSGWNFYNFFEVGEIHLADSAGVARRGGGEVPPPEYRRSACFGGCFFRVSWRFQEHKVSPGSS